MEFLNKNTVIESNMHKNTILIGVNGSGKTSFLKKIMKTNKIRINSDEEAEDVEVLFAGVENVKDDVDASKAKYKEYVSDFKESLDNVEFPNNNELAEQTSIALNTARDTLSSSLQEEIISPKIKLVHTLEINPTISSKHHFTFNDEIFALKDMPSGVRKLIHIYFSTKKETNIKKIILLDEIDSMLHPSWIKLVTDLVKTWMDRSDIFVVITTHKPETIYQLNAYLEYIAKINNGSVEYINIPAILGRFNDINSHFLPNFERISESDMIKKIKTKFSFQLARALFSQEEKILLTEGLTDQMFFKNKTSKIVISIFGYYQIGLYLSLIEWVKNGFTDVCVILDGDNKLTVANSSTYLLKTKLENLAITNFFFEMDLEHSLFNETPENNGNRFTINQKFKILEEHYDDDISFSEDLLRILDD